MTFSRFHFGNLTPAEIELIRAAHRDHRPAADVAREIGCTDRTVRKHYYRLNYGYSYQPKPSKPRAEKKPTPDPRPPRQDRFYHSDFVPS